MRFLIDANLPFKLDQTLKDKGYDVIHTDNLPNKERTTDKEIRKIAVDKNYTIISKDSDFLDSHLLQRIPTKLLFVAIGKIINKDLIDLFNKNFEAINKLFDSYDLIELNNKQIIGHEK